jgi:transposase
MTEIKLITSSERRRKWSIDEKRQIIEETYRPGMSVSQVARKYGIMPSQLFYWRRTMEEGALKGIACGEEVVAKSQIKELEKRIRYLERLLGRKTEEVEILKEAVKIGREKKLISRAPLPGLEDLGLEE